MTNEDRISYLNFCCGLLLGTLVSIRDKSRDEEDQQRIDYCLDTVNPLIAKVYEFQAQAPTEHTPTK